MPGLEGIPAELTPEYLAKVELEYCIKLCRAGNPFPLVALQWPSLLVTDPEEIRYFEGEPGSDSNPCLRLDDWQRDIIQSFFDPSMAEIYIKGCTKAGKGASVSIACNLWFYVYQDSKIFLTSQRFDHAQKVIFGEFSRWKEQMRHPDASRLLAAGVVDTTRHYVAIINPSTGEGFSGQHGGYCLFVLDEASSVPNGRYDDACKQARLIVSLANPRVMSGWFYSGYSLCNDINKTQTVVMESGLHRRCFTVDGEQCMNVRNKRLERAIAPRSGLAIKDRDFKGGEKIPPEYYEHAKLLIPEQVDYSRLQSIMSHPDRRHVDVFAHGFFPEEDPEKQVILMSWLRRHIEAYNAEAIKVEAFSLDPAASEEGDETALGAGGLQGIREIITTQKSDTMVICGWSIRTVADKYGIDLTKGRNPMVVDMDGIGKGVGDRLRELGVWVIEYHGNASSQLDPHRYGNLRAEAYAELGRRVNPKERWGDQPPFMLPPGDDMLYQDLCAPEKIYGGDALRFHLMPKRRAAGMADTIVTVEDKIGRSPDRGDAAVMLYCGIRQLHMLDAWMQGVDSPLAVWPAPPPPQKGDPPPETDLVKWLEQKYGKLPEKAAPQTREAAMGDWDLNDLYH